MFLMLSGGYFTFKSRFFQFRNFKKSIKAFFGGNGGQKGGFNSFQSVCTSLSATIGTGNIAGVAGAISVGGAGAVFWMWITALVGMCVKAAEIAISVKYREKNGTAFVGGPMYYIKNALPKGFAPLGFLFAFVGIFSVICSGNITQTNAVVLTFATSFKVKLITGILLGVITALVIIGGAKKIGTFTERVVPVMSLLYIGLCMFLILKNSYLVPHAFKMIFKGAFNPCAVTGGAVGSICTTALTGASRGVFSNEAGLGTSAMAHSVAIDAKPQVQGLYGIFEVFADTLLLCTLTALTILCSGVNIDYTTVASSELVNVALATVYGKTSSVLLTVMMSLFGISSIIGWALYGIICSEYIFAKNGKRIFIAVYPLGCIIGAVTGAEFAWRIAAFCTGIMLCINVTALLLLSDKVLPLLNKKEVKNDKLSNKRNTKAFTKRGSGAYLQ